MEKAQRYLQTCSVDLALEAKGRAGHSDVRHTAVHCASDGLQLWELHSPVSWCIHTLDVSLRVDDLDFISSLRFFFIRCHVLWFLFISPLQSLPPVLSLILSVLLCCFTWLYLICKVWLTKQEKQGQPPPPQWGFTVCRLLFEFDYLQICMGICTIEKDIKRELHRYVILWLLSCESCIKIQFQRLY